MQKLPRHRKSMGRGVRAIAGDNLFSRQLSEKVRLAQILSGRFRLRCSNWEGTVADMKPIQAVCDKCKKTVEAKPLLSENELWLALNKGDEIEVMHLADDVHHTWKLTGQDKESLRKARAAGTV
jgi:hypothetical protein